MLSKVRTAGRMLRALLRRRRVDEWVRRMERHAHAGEFDAALGCFRRATRIDPFPSEPYHLLAGLLMPAENYLQILKRVHEYLRPTTYVEIGVCEGVSLALADAKTMAVGIDPNPRIRNVINCVSKIYPMTSDRFFAELDLVKELDSRRPALVFIDGLHQFEQVLKDFDNVERFSDAATVVLIHDCLPLDRRLASREPRTNLWCGDVWKVVPALREVRPDLRISVIPAQPSGIALITNLDRTSTTLRDRFDEIVARYRDAELDYATLDRSDFSIAKCVPCVAANNWPTIAALLPHPGPAVGAA